MAVRLSAETEPLCLQASLPAQLAYHMRGLIVRNSDPVYWVFRVNALPLWEARYHPIVRSATLVSGALCCKVSIRLLDLCQQTVSIEHQSHRKVGCVVSSAEF